MKDINKKAVGSRIKQIRTTKGYTLEGFGNLLNADKSNVRKWEIGFTLPNKKRQLDIAKLGGISVNELLYGNIEKDIEELYQALIKLPKGSIINLMMKVAIEFENRGEKEF